MSWRIGTSKTYVLGTQKKGVEIHNSEDHVQNLGKGDVRSEVEGYSKNSDVVDNSEDDEEEDIDNPKEEAGRTNSLIPLSQLLNL